MRTHWYSRICVLILLHMCPRTATYVSSYCYICVRILTPAGVSARSVALEHFYERHARGRELVLKKWFAMQAEADVDGALQKV